MQPPARSRFCERPSPTDTPGRLRWDARLQILANPKGVSSRNEITKPTSSTRGTAGSKTRASSPRSGLAPGTSADQAHPDDRARRTRHSVTYHGRGRPPLGEMPCYEIAEMLPK